MAITGNAFLEVLQDFVRRSENIELDYMVTGSFAMAAYGELRFTRDIDIVIELQRKKINIFLKAFEEEYYISENSINRAIDRESMFNIIHLEKAVKIDCIIRKNSDFEKIKFSRRRIAKIDDFSFWTITKEDLILSKLNWAKDSLSEVQIEDIANLTATNYDSDYVDLWVKNLNLIKLWERVLEWKIRQQK